MSTVKEGHVDVQSYLEQRRQSVGKPKVRRLKAKEAQRHNDIHWALHDPNVQAKYQGQFVVPYEGEIIAHGEDAETVLQEAERISGKKASELPLVGIDDPLQDIPQ
jgi:ABC-type hemin transport system ATPase subunit